jgi:hypothetical protein
MSFVSSSKSERFVELVNISRETHLKLAEVAKEQVNLAHEINLEIIREAFPGVEVAHENILVIVKPSDLAKSANDAVAYCRENGLTPSAIIVEPTLKWILLIK